ncbi:cytochrome oxidase subunit II family protein [Burkholderia pseudomallei MSHR3960]|nr:cytochrome oxidase subunit II family protein [Burkholderia pseudomallei MSHR3960]
MLLDLVPLWAGVLALSVLMYVLLDGFDLGVGMLFFFHRDEAERDRMIASVSPVWDFNETWLVLGGTLLLAAFPGAFSVVVPAVYFPVLAMLLGLLFRGVAFEFRGVAGARKTVWSRAFAIGSLVATAAQGVVLGMFVQGFEVAHGRFVGTSWDWVAPFPLVTGAGLVAGYLLLGATWLVLKTDGPLQRAARVAAARARVRDRVHRRGERVDAACRRAHRRALVRVAEPAVLLAGAGADRRARVACRAQPAAWRRSVAVRRVDRPVLPCVFRAHDQPVAARRAAVDHAVVGRVGERVAGIPDDRHRVHAAGAAVLRVLVILGVPRQGAARRRRLRAHVTRRAVRLARAARLPRSRAGRRWHAWALSQARTGTRASASADDRRPRATSRLGRARMPGGTLATNMGGVSRARRHEKNTSVQARRAAFAPPARDGRRRAALRRSG